MQRLQFTSAEAIRLTRELWEILRRKQGCTLNRLYRSSEDEMRWMAYSEWSSLAELAGARREVARSPLNRRLHSMLGSSSERAYEPFGAVRSVHGVNFASAPVALLISVGGEMENPEEAFGFLSEQPGHLSHILMHEVNNPAATVCLAHFESADCASNCARLLTDQPVLRELQPSTEQFVV